jgi:hypothetical protein
MQYPSNIRWHASLQHGNQSLVFFHFRFLKSFAAFDRAAPVEIDLDSTGGSALGSPWILLIQQLSSLSRISILEVPVWQR